MYVMKALKDFEETYWEMTIWQLMRQLLESFQLFMHAKADGYFISTETRLEKMFGK